VAKNAKSRARAAAADRAPSIDRTRVTLVCIAGWILPGAGHLWLGRRQKGVVFLAALTLMFAMGLYLEGRIFPVQLSEPLVALAGVADAGLGLPYLVARVAGLGAGRVVAEAYEYGNTFLIVAGLMNFLVIIDAFDVALGRK
jgi:hypothetical protein